MCAPHVSGARLRRRYRLGSYVAGLFGNIESVGAIRYLYLLAALKGSEHRPALVVAVGSLGVADEPELLGAG